MIYWNLTECVYNVQLNRKKNCVDGVAGKRKYTYNCSLLYRIQASSIVQIMYECTTITNHLKMCIIFNCIIRKK